jgi:hypothetical protein
MQVPRFSPRISLIEMAPRTAPRSGYPSRPAMPCPALPLPYPVCHQVHRERGVTGRIFQALPTQTNTTVALIYKIRYSLEKKPPLQPPTTPTQAESYNVRLLVNGY